MTNNLSLEDLKKSINAMSIEEREEIISTLSQNEQWVRQEGQGNVAINETQGNVTITVHQGAPAEEVKKILAEVLQSYTATKTKTPSSLKFFEVIFSILFVVGIILTIRQFGGLELIELKTFDRLMRSRPTEAVDPRLLVVEATEADLRRYGYPLSDAILAETIEKLKTYQVQTISLDIWREIPREPGHERLVEAFKNNKNLVAVCAVGNPEDPDKASLGLAEDLSIPDNQIGFSDVVVDRDSVLRRHLVLMNPVLSFPCSTSLSLSLQTALHYLSSTENIKPDWTEDEQLKIGSVVFSRLKSNFGGYRNIDDRGYQIFLNYRFNKYRQLNAATTVTLSDVIDDKVNTELLKDKIAMIGVTARSAEDYFSTPHGGEYRSVRQLSGVEIQAQMVSQILSAVLDNRLQIRSWPEWGEVLWISLWGFVGGAIAWKVGPQQVLVVASGGAILTGIGIAWLLLVVYGLWIPFVPSILALVTTEIAIMVLSHRKTSRF